jgi:hypothetical protein
LVDSRHILLKFKNKVLKKPLETGQNMPFSKASAKVEIIN